MATQAVESTFVPTVDPSFQRQSFEDQHVLTDDLTILRQRYVSKEDHMCEEQKKNTNNIPLPLQLPVCQPMNVHFENITYDATIETPHMITQRLVRMIRGVMNRWLKPTTPVDSPTRVKRILFDMSAAIQGGRLVALMGASGAGKSSLLNILSGREKSTSGTVKLNDEPLSKSMIKNSTAYVQQKDLFLNNLTPEEHLYFQLRLRLPSSTDPLIYSSFRDALVNHLGLTRCRKTSIKSSGDVGGLSGGEKKRLTIASELCCLPSVLFADEPTTGLDFVTARSVVSYLRRLADSGRTVIASIHQPSSVVFDMFHDIVLLAEGRLLFMGSRLNCIAWFAQLGYRCPGFFNVADFLIKTTSIPNDPAQRETKIALLDSWAHKWKNEGQLFIKSRDTQEDERMLGEISAFTHKQCTLFGAPHLQSSSVAEGNDMKQYSQAQPLTPSRQTKDVELSITTLPTLSPSTEKDTLRWWKQVCILCKRTLTNDSRDRMHIIVRLLQSMLLGFVVGFLFFRLGWTFPDATTRMSATYMVLMNQSMSGAFAVIHTFAFDKPVIYREYHAGLLYPSAYIVAKMLSDTATQVAYPVLFISITFWLINMGSEIVRFLKMVLIVILLTNSALSIGYLASSLGSCPEVSAVICNLITFPLSMFGGFLVNLSDTKAWISWIQYASFIKHGFFGSLNVLFRDQQVCCVDGKGLSGLDFIHQRLSVPELSFGATIGLLFLIFVAYRSISILLGTALMLRIASTET